MNTKSNRLILNLPIKNKLTLITMLACGVALVFMGIAFMFYEQASLRTAMVSDTQTAAQMAGLNTAAALSFDQPADAERTLRSFAADHHVIFALIYDRSGKPFARYQRPDIDQPILAPVASPPGHRFSDDYLEVFEDLDVEGDKIGTVYVRKDLVHVSEQLLRNLAILAAIVVGASVIAYLLMQRLHRVITLPISHLAEVTRAVTLEKNFELRAVKQSEDELGQLTRAFNEMLDEIQRRDSALQSARDTLEERVNERTQELQEEVLERRRTERERDRIFTLSLDLLCVGGMDGLLQRVNPAFAKVLGFEPPKHWGKSLVDFAHADDRRTVAAMLEKLTAGEVVTNCEVRMIGSHGTERWVSWSVTPVTGENIFYAYGRDVTQRKEADSEMERMNHQMRDISRQAGMAEVATSVLHNVGNVLNSVNVSCSVITDKVRKSRIGSVSKTAELLNQHAADLPGFFRDNPSGKLLPGFLTKLAERLDSEREAVLEELQLLGSNIEHIKEIVAVQQSYARNVGGVRETLPISSLVEDALRMNSAALVRHGVEVIREFEDVPAICVEKHKVLQILVNLVSNAKYALSDSGRPDRLLRIKVGRTNGHVAVVVSDNGIGIAPENLTRIFGHGFTTKKDGHGFGLHSGVLAAKEMGGRLCVHSDGPGKGAIFTLELPITGSTSAHEQ